MELVPGISAHFVQSKSLKQIKLLSFYCSLSLETIAGRMLCKYVGDGKSSLPNIRSISQILGRSLYGTDISTGAYRRGQAHILDLTFTYVR